MNCVAVCQDDLIVKTLHEALSPTLDIKFLVDTQSQGHRLNKYGIPTQVGDPCQATTYTQANITADTCIIVEDNDRSNIQAIVDAASNAGTSLVYVLLVGTHTNDQTKKASALKNASTLALSELTKTSLINALDQSLTRSLVKQYQQHFEDADRILILLHNLSLIHILTLPTIYSV